MASADNVAITRSVEFYAASIWKAAVKRLAADGPLRRYSERVVV